MKDNFSTDSDKYAKFRPVYPAEFYLYLKNILPACEHAWDCGTGNGQVADALSSFFQQVNATDISEQQISHAIKKHNIHYSVQPAEKVNFADNLFDLVIVGQAIHWFQFDEFYKEVNRTSKNNALFVIIGYGRVKLAGEADALLQHFYKNIIGSYWDQERKHIDEKYHTIPFPFEEINAPAFTLSFEWDAEHLLGYINTWSAVKHFTKANGFNPTMQFSEELLKKWPMNEIRTVQFPLLLRIGRIRK